MNKESSIDNLPNWKNISRGPLSPSLKFDIENMTLEIKGKSIMEDPNDFWSNIISYIQLWVSNVQIKEMHIYLDEINGISKKCLLDIFEIFQDVETNSPPTINLNYDSRKEGEDVYYFGELVRNLFTGEVYLIPVPYDYFF